MYVIRHQFTLPEWWKTRFNYWNTLTTARHVTLKLCNFLLKTPNGSFYFPSYLSHGAYCWIEKVLQHREEAHPYNNNKSERKKMISCEKEEAIGSCCLTASDKVTGWGWCCCEWSTQCMMHNRTFSDIWIIFCRCWCFDDYQKMVGSCTHAFFFSMEQKGTINWVKCLCSSSSWPLQTIVGDKLRKKLPWSVMSTMPRL